jgi:hypothetical protein
MFRHIRWMLLAGCDTRLPSSSDARAPTYPLAPVKIDSISCSRALVKPSFGKEPATIGRGCENVSRALRLLCAVRGSCPTGETPRLAGRHGPRHRGGPLPSSPSGTVASRGPLEVFCAHPALEVYEEGIDALVGEVKLGEAHLTVPGAGKGAGFRPGAHRMLPGVQDPGGGVA